jgi:hypothetical protein
LLHNYLLPRDCPRVTFYAGPETSEADRARFLALGGAGHVVVIEKGWLERVRQARLWVYEMPEGAFSCALEGAGYFVARVAVQPKRVIEITDVLGALNARDVELRVVPSLWALRDAVAASTLAFSCIRMRHALPRGRGAEELILS